MSEEAEVQLKHDGIDYVVTAEYEVERIDDSFDGHAYGRVATFEAHHWEIDYDTLDIISCIGGLDEDEDVDPDDVKGLYDAIVQAVIDNHEKYHG